MNYVKKMSTGKEKKHLCPYKHILMLYQRELFLFTLSSKLLSSFYHLIMIIIYPLNKRQIKSQEQSRMHNPETRATLATRYRAKTNQTKNTPPKTKTLQKTGVNWFMVFINQTLQTMQTHINQIGRNRLLSVNYYSDHSRNTTSKLKRPIILKCYLFH